MDGRGRWMDNVFIERLWRSVKYEDIYLKEYARIPDLRAGLREWFERYNTWRLHAELGNQTPAVVHLERRKEKGAAPIPVPPLAEQMRIVARVEEGERAKIPRTIRGHFSV